MSEHEEHPEQNPEPGEPTEGGTLPEESEPEGKTSLRKGDVEWEGEKGGRGGRETHGAGEHDDPSN
jgi:hypothetical protein